MDPDRAESRRRPPLWPGVLAVILVALALLLGALAVATWKDLAVSTLTRDPLETAGLRWQTGFLYKVSLLIWGGTAMTCLLGAAIRRRAGDAHALHAFLLGSAALTLVFAVDDVFQLRVEYLDHLGLPEVTVFVVYVVVLCVFAAAFGRILLRTEYGVLAAALVLFVAWLGLRQAGAGLAVQDGVRLLGQLVLLLYFFRTSAYGTSPGRI